jgi:hypothetical protein
MKSSAVTGAWRRTPTSAALTIVALGILGLSTATPARAGEHDFYGWRDGYAGPVYGYYLAAPPYGYYYPVSSYPYLAVGFYDARSYYSYYYGRPDFGYQDTK